MKQFAIRSFVTAAFVTAAFVALATSTASAHALLDHAVPAVGGTVSGSPGELHLSFSQDVEVAFSAVTLASAGGGAIPVGKPVLEGHKTLRVPLARALPPGTYVVKWHVVSVDTHPTSGSYRFVIAP